MCYSCFNGILKEKSGIEVTVLTQRHPPGFNSPASYSGIPGPKTGYPDWRFSVITSSPSRQISE
jgi:hypothetical protein